MKYRLLAAGCWLLCAFQDAPPPAPQEPAKEPTAEEIFNRMMEKLSSAKSVQCAFGTTGTHVKGREVTAEGTLQSKGDDRFRLIVKGKSEERMGTLTIASDGKYLTVIADDGRQPQPLKLTKDAPDAIATSFIKAISQGGVLFTTGASGQAAKNSEMDDESLAFEPADFGEVTRETVDERQAYRLSYSITHEMRPGREVTADFVLWVDSESLLPLKRTVRSEERELDMEDTYSDWKLDEEIDDGEFEIE